MSVAIFWFVESDHMESLALHNSGGTTSGRQSALSQHSVGDAVGTSQNSDDDGDSGSDWDSWDESEQESGDGEAIYADFMKRLHNTLLSQGKS